MARPRVKLKLTLIDKVIEVVAFLALVFLWILTVSNYSSLPEIIPTHFNASGAVDDYGSKSTILILPVIATVLFAGLTLLNKIPHLFNYPTEITKENAERQYYSATRLMRFLKFILVIALTLIVHKTNETVLGNSQGLGRWFLPLILGLFAIPVIVYVIKSRVEK